jgi:hypothetical protein
MATKQTGIIKTDGRLRDNDLRAQARLAWCLAGEGTDRDAKAARHVGVSTSCIQIWRQSNEPDGQDWEQFRVELALANHQAQMDLLATHDEVQVHLEVLKASQRLLGAVSASLNEGVLYDGPLPKKGDPDTRKEVTQLWSQDGQQVTVGPLRPKTASEAVRMLSGISLTLDNSYKRVEHLLRMRGDAQKIEDEVFLLCCQVVRELWGEDGHSKFWTAVTDKNAEAAAEQSGEGQAPTRVEPKADDTVIDAEWEDDDDDAEEDNDD